MSRLREVGAEGDELKARDRAQDAAEALKPAAQGFFVVALTTKRVGAGQALMDIRRDCFQQSQLVTHMFKLLPKETEIETDNTLEYDPLTATLGWLDEIVGREEDQEVSELRSRDRANSR